MWKVRSTFLDGAVGVLANAAAGLMGLEDASHEALVMVLARPPSKDNWVIAWSEFDPTQGFDDAIAAGVGVAVVRHTLVYKVGSPDEFIGHGARFRRIVIRGIEKGIEKLRLVNPAPRAMHDELAAFVAAVRHPAVPPPGPEASRMYNGVLKLYFDATVRINVKVNGKVVAIGLTPYYYSIVGNFLPHRRNCKNWVHDALKHLKNEFRHL